ncbi:MAG: tRNA epoxyqueuosine(34) reductase QueG, partial [Cystobacterineae bacterium]|nr:tRNA epoxyqueuosine(34) reductase QueG [Cystobacterineae bacterium]
MALLDTAWVRACAQEVGFELCGFAAAQPLEGAFLWQWLGEGLGEGMPWLEETAALRLDIGR